MNQQVKGKNHLSKSVSSEHKWAFRSNFSRKLDLDTKNVGLMTLNHNRLGIKCTPSGFFKSISFLQKYLVVDPNAESVTQKTAVKESVGQQKWDYDHHEIEEFADHKSKVVDVVLVVNIFGKKLKVLFENWLIGCHFKGLLNKIPITLTSLSLFSSGSSTNLLVVPLPKNFINPPSIKSQMHLGR